MRLYGFSDPAERALFLDLQKVDGVGPRGALEDPLRRGPGRSFPRPWTRTTWRRFPPFPGIGKKTAQKIILTLKGKLTPALEGSGRSAEDDITTALVGMGFDRRTAKDAVTAAAKSVAAKGMKGEELERELFKRAVAIAGGETNAGPDGSAP